ncbi:MAG: SpoIIE family protein phosphatase, partial [Thermoanaerobaculia bacterium]|nr:SpoIIE family protein phosphatase [Thermoanaerobaculia bacterium]
AKTVEFDLEPGDCIVYLSDGIIEALNPDGYPFGFDRLEEILAFMVEDDPEPIKKSILSAVRDHGRGLVPDDDRTIMILKFDREAKIGARAETGFRDVAAER